jgi:hypothetical protein
MHFNLQSLTPSGYTVLRDGDFKSSKAPEKPPVKLLTNGNALSPAKNKMYQEDWADATFIHSVMYCSMDGQ